MFLRTLQNVKTHKPSILEASGFAAKSMLCGTAGALYTGTAFIIAGFLSGIYPRETALTTKEVTQKSEVRRATMTGFATGAAIPLVIKLGLLASRRVRVNPDVTLSAAITLTSTAAMSFKK
jgi:hypothetical protein